MATMMSAAAVTVALITLLWHSIGKVRIDRVTRTFEFLIATRSSERLVELRRLRKQFFAEGEPISAEWFARHIHMSDIQVGSDSNLIRSREAAEAIREMLNTYEFMALRASKSDLDRNILRKALRGIVSSFVIDCMPAIEHARSQNPVAYRHLVELYQEWRSLGDPEFRDR